MKEFRYIPSGEVCSQEFIFTFQGKKIRSLQVIGGCHGNLQGISRLAEDREIEEVITLLSGIRCGGKMTSCPDQIARALKKYLEEDLPSGQ